MSRGMNYFNISALGNWLFHIVINKLSLKDILAFDLRYTTPAIQSDISAFDLGHTTPTIHYTDVKEHTFK